MFVKRKLTYEEVCERFRDKGLELLEKEYINNHTRMKCRDGNGYLYAFSINNLEYTNINRKFDNRNPYVRENMQLFVSAINDNMLILDVFNKNKRRHVIVRCKLCGNIKEYAWNTISRSGICYCDCNYVNPKKHSYKYIYNKFKEYGYTLIDTEYKGNNVAMQCYDSKGYKVRISYSNLMYDKVPSRFSLRYNEKNYIFNINHYCKLNNIQYKAVKLIKKIKYKDSYIGTVYGVCKCGNTFNTNIWNIATKTLQCKTCFKRQSSLEYKVEQYLQKYNVLYYSEYRFDDCRDKKPLPFDFYLVEYNIVIEVDGEQHYRPIQFGDDDALQSFIVRKQHDELKDDYCKANGICMIRLPYFTFNDDGYVKILNKHLLNK